MTKINNVAVIGTGVIGAGWIIRCLAHNNIVYAFDENYNQQAFVSICSFMENVSEECHVFIVHRDGASFNKYEQKLVKMFSNLRLTVKTFTNESYYFPNLDSGVYS